MFNTSSRWYYPLRWLILIVLGLIIYAQTFGYGFVFDDQIFIVKNPFIRAFSYVHYNWKLYPQTRTLGFYSFAFNYIFNQLNPLGYHLFNFAVHLLAAGLVWATAGILFKITGFPTKDRFCQEIPYIIAVFFLVHPCQTQAVSYISQRFESMATVFYIGSIYCYLRGRIAKLAVDKTFLFSCSIGFALLGILTKEVAATIPLMILAAEVILFRGNPRKTYILLIVIGIVYAALFMKLVRTDFRIFVHFPPTPSESHDGDIITAQNYVLTQMRVFLTFLRLLILPVGQNVDYDYPLSNGLLNPPMTLAGMGVLGTIVFLIFKLRKKFPIIAFGMAWVLITFAINLAPRANVIFEHKFYLMSFGFFLVLLSTLFMIIRQKMLLFKLLVILIAAMTFLSFLRNQVWKNEQTLWEDVVNKSPLKSRPQINLGSVYFRQGHYPEALARYNQAIVLNPKSAEAYYGCGNVYEQEGDFSQALADYTKAIALNPSYWGAYLNRGNTFAKRGNFTQALIDYDKIIQIQPNSPQVYISLGNIYFQESKYAQALTYYNKALTMNPGNAEGYYNRGFAYFQMKNYRMALMDVLKAKELGIDVGPTLIPELKEDILKHPKAQ